MAVGGKEEGEGGGKKEIEIKGLPSVNIEVVCPGQGEIWSQWEGVLSCGGENYINSSGSFRARERESERKQQSVSDA